MCDDFQSAGIDAFVDITKGDSATDFDTALPEWIRVSDFVVLVGSTSYATRSKDPSTLTFIEATEIGKKKQINSNHIIPVLFEGSFRNSFPPGYQDTIGERFILPTDFMKELPGVAAAILGIAKDEQVSLWLATHSKEAQFIIDRGAKNLLHFDRDQTKSGFTTQ
jgi:hypothetical protein